MIQADVAFDIAGTAHWHARNCAAVVAAAVKQ